MGEGLLHGLDDGGVALRRDAAREDAPGRLAVLVLDVPMGLGEGEVLHLEAVVPDQGVLLERGLGPLRRAFLDLAALVGGALKEEGGDGGAHVPAAPLHALVEEGAIANGALEELDAIEAREVHAEAARDLEEELRVGTPAAIPPVSSS